jgi:hypothetical protein
MKIDSVYQIMSCLKMGLYTDSERLKQLDHDFSETLKSAYNLGLEQDFSTEWNTTWNQRWLIVENLLLQINGLVSEVNECIESSEGNRLNEAVDIWKMIQLKDDYLVKVISSIRQQASAMNAAAQSEWNLLATAFDSNLETIHACSQAQQVKLNLLREQPKKWIKLLEQLPKHPITDELDTNQYQQELNTAAIEIEKKQHKPGGFLDVVKALFLWVETPEERVIIDRSLRIDQTPNLYRRANTSLQS